MRPKCELYVCKATDINGGQAYRVILEDDKLKDRPLAFQNHHGSQNLQDLPKLIKQLEKTFEHVVVSDSKGDDTGLNDYRHEVILIFDVKPEAACDNKHTLILIEPLTSVERQQFMRFYGEIVHPNGSCCFTEA